MHSKKQTAANNVFLKNTRKRFNAPIYAQALALLNSEGEEAARAFVQSFVNKPLDY